MKITFIRPNMQDVRSSVAVEPLAFAILAGLTPPDDEICFFDERLESIPLDHETDLVAITIDTFSARRAYQIATRFRRLGTPVVAGGYHATFRSQEVLEHVDTVVLGDAEEEWPTIVEHARGQRLKRMYSSGHQPSLEQLRFDREIFCGKRYQPIFPVQVGRGCKYACDFCSIHAFYGSNIRYRPISDVIDEILVSGATRVFFVDDNLVLDRARAMAFFDALLPLGIRWGSQLSIDVAQDDDLLSAMMRSGCECVFVGFESLSENNLRAMKKGWSIKHQDYQTAIRKLREHGIMIYGSFVFGYDHDRRDVFERTAEFAIRSKMMLANFAAIVPMPGTALFARLHSDGRLLFDRWWLDPGYRYGQAVFRPAQMTPDQLTEGCIRARESFYSYRSLLSRFADLQSNSRSLWHLALFWGSNVLSRRELRVKLGLPLGSVGTIEPA
jgi:radical SAM superfamily enzyme YgiQ (UPF0313 family)